jgi:hypothetical protein
MAETPTDVLVAAFRDVQAATSDFDALLGLAGEGRHQIEGPILVAHAGR